MTHRFETLRGGQWLDESRSRSDAKSDTQRESRSFNFHLTVLRSHEYRKISEGKNFVVTVDGHDDKTIFEAEPVRGW